MTPTKPQESRGLPPQFFDPNFVVYINTLRLRAVIALWDWRDPPDDMLLQKMLEIEKADKEKL